MPFPRQSTRSQRRNDRPAGDDGTDRTWTSLLRRTRLDGPPLRLVGPLDRAADGWWRLPPRVRALAIAGLVALVVVGVVQRTSRSPWGPTRPVVVAIRDGAAGMAIAATVQSRPQAVIPDDALDTVPTGRLARDIGAGEVLTDDHVAGDLDDLLGVDEVAVALAQELPALPAHARLDLVATGFDGTGHRLGDARLLVVEEGWTWIAVAADDAPSVAAALATGGVTVAVAPPPGG